MQPSPPAPDATATGIALASIAARAGAWVIDQLLVMIPSMVIGAVVLLTRIDLTETPAPGLEEMADATPVWLPFVAIGLRVAYDAVMVAWLGRTIGMMALRIRVVSAAGERLTWWQSGIRAIVPGIAQSIPNFGTFAMVGVYLAAGFDERRRGLHDHAAGSLVVSVPKPAPVLPPNGFTGWYPGTPPPPPPDDRR